MGQIVTELLGGMKKSEEDLASSIAKILGTTNKAKNMAD